MGLSGTECETEGSSLANLIHIFKINIKPLSVWQPNLRSFAYSKVISTQNLCKKGTQSETDPKKNLSLFLTDMCVLTYIYTYMHICTHILKYTWIAMEPIFYLHELSILGFCTVIECSSPSRSIEPEAMELSLLDSIGKEIRWFLARIKRDMWHGPWLFLDSWRSTPTYCCP